MNFRRLKYFVKIVDIGSLTQAAEYCISHNQRSASRLPHWKVS
ncbi:nitrogen assimilation transcriptional regulator [Escherichia coli]|uniref:Nitrogen assimilation transcriptional regulator n=1 Tax=Escherichia coli TaxID=562 RepID=A0A377B937_ECOLX|nr:nitrogen assimilation transcriptional regulator [Escherichia coli]